ncbi:hypothetical protein LWC34_48525 [Kibdelosporangium philippinense]|uniref:Uncharacterized protein n=1 Tax=Kibdelosporangium philippinense TaxID=211113 RepID=A0ABS8ZUE3_9PSEU|nr:hypothetical protein [Kibdelosporangium philippinense]MCE7010600.1 hypothetical protein [Kibdelosporangium philippinense]
MTRHELPRRREMPPEVRDRLRRKLWSQLDVPARSWFVRARAPIAAVVGAVAVLIGGSVVLAQNVSSSSTAPAAAAFGSENVSLQRANADLDRCYATATAAHDLPERPQWLIVTSSEVNGVTVTAARVEGRPVFCETTATTVTVSDPDGVPGYAAPSQTAAMFTTSNGVVAGVVDSAWRGFDLRVSVEPDASEIITPQLSGDIFVARAETDLQNPRTKLYALHETSTLIFSAPPPALVTERLPSN